MDVTSRVILLNWNNGKRDFKLPNRVSFFDNFDFDIDDTRITITHANQKFHFGHPAIAQRQFTTKKKTIKFTVNGLIFQTLNDGQYTSHQPMDVYLEFDKMYCAADFTTNLLAHNYKEV